MKALGIIIVILIILAGGYLYFFPATSSDQMSEEGPDPEVTLDTRVPVTEGMYVAVPEESIVHWAGKKPLIDGYIDSGSIAISEGGIIAGADRTLGGFTMDMNTISVSETPKKPGQESMLEEHLKSENWFNVEEFPTAHFKITSAVPTGGDDPFAYTITGDLTMKGVTDALTFPATVYLNEKGDLVAEARFEFDRTKWDVTAMSGSFFDNLAENVIDDMVELSFTLIAKPVPEGSHIMPDGSLMSNEEMMNMGDDTEMSGGEMMEGDTMMEQ